MAYSNWGGDVFLNGKSVAENKCDVGVFDDSQDANVPHGARIWLYLVGNRGDSDAWHNRPHHAVLGNGKVRIGLYKTSFELYVADDGGNVTRVEAKDFGLSDRLVDSYAGKTDINYDELSSEACGVTFRYMGHEITVECEENKISAEMVDPDGNKWSGYSGYCIGAGHEF